MSRNSVRRSAQPSRSSGDSPRTRFGRFRRTRLGRIAITVALVLVAVGLCIANKRSVVLVIVVAAAAGLWWLTTRKGTTRAAPADYQKPPAPPVADAIPTTPLFESTPTPVHHAYLHDLRDARSAPIELRGDAESWGRGSSNTIVVADAETSRQHAQFRRDPRTGRWSVAALSDAPTVVNGRLLPPGGPPTEIGDGAVILLGSLVYRAAYSDSPSQQPPSPSALTPAARPVPAPAPATRHRLRQYRSEHAAAAAAGGDQSRTHVMPPAIAPLRVVAAGETSPGDRRHNNDVFLIRKHAVAIADAAGGGDDGVITARTVRTSLRELLPHTPVDGVFAAIDQALRQLRGESVLAAPSTLDVLTLDAASATVYGGHVGDSQVLLARTNPADGTIRITPMTATPRPYAPLDNAVGFFAAAPADHTYRLTRWEQPAAAGDRYIMVTDGFLRAWHGPHTQTDAVPDLDPADAVHDVLSALPDPSPARLADALLHAAFNAHKHRRTPADNITVVVAHLVPATAAREER